MLRFEIEYRPELKTHFYAELWSAETFAVKMVGSRTPCEVKGDERKIGCKFKLDVLRPYWMSWEGTEQGGVRTLWAAFTERIDMPPAPHVKLIRPGVNVARWVAEEGPEPEPVPDLPPIDEPGPGPEPEPIPAPIPYVPDPTKLPCATTLVGRAEITRTQIHFWGTEETPGREVIYQMPLHEYVRLYEESGLFKVLVRLRDQLEAGNYSAEWHMRG